MPELAADFLDHWALRLDGPAGHGMASLVLPVIRTDGTLGALKLQPVSEENAAAPIGLRAWNGDGVVRLLAHDPDTGTMLLERLDATRPLSSVADDTAALRILAELLARLVAVPAPEDLRHLADIAAAMLDQVPRAVPRLRDPAQQRLVRTCASAMAELIGEPGDRLLHWDLHYDNILAGQREPWLAIDPEPLAGDPGFDLVRRCTTGGTRWWRPATWLARCSAASTCSPRCSAWTGNGRPAGRSAACCRTRCGTSKTAKPHWTRPRSPSPQPCLHRQALTRRPI
ncbi:MAG TPA: aminoglycoside phosphotransferase family protein [Pseudonocardiaceae bacterium]|nr:aminoglycoside phosphotransferase family protein [Pseudonocardiaceae bacterium]